MSIEHQTEDGIGKPHGSCHQQSMLCGGYNVKISRSVLHHKALINATTWCCRLLSASTVSGASRSPQATNCAAVQQAASAVAAVLQKLWNERRPQLPKAWATEDLLLCRVS